MDEQNTPRPPKTSERRNSTYKESIELNLNLPAESDEDGITFKEIFLIFKRGFAKIFVFTLISLLIGIISAAVYYFITLEYVGSVTGIISFNYKGAEEGLDPHERELDVTKLRSVNVLDKVVSELDLYQKGVTVEDLRSNIDIEGVVPKDVLERILIIKEIATKDPSYLEKLTEVSYIPTQYAITLNIPKEFSFLTKAKGKEVLSAIFAAYKDYFMEEYSDRAVLETVVGNMSFENYDYSETADILAGQVNNMIAYLTAKRTDSPDFRANSTQMTFGEIISSLNIIKNIDINNLRATVVAQTLSKDRARLVSIYRYTITQKTLEKEVALENARIAQEAAVNYEKSSAVMFSGTGSDSDSPLMEFKQSSEVYDELVRRAAEASEEANQLQSDINYYESRIADFQNGAASNRAADIEAAEASIVSITEKLHNWIEIINNTVDEYIETEALKDATKIVLVPQYTSGLMDSLKMMLVITLGVTFIGFIVGTVSVYSKKLMG